MTVRKYNPGFLSDDELVASFCVRTHEFDSVLEMLSECTGRSNCHQLVIGPRGSGKTSLLLRVAAEVRRDEDLRARFFPIVFAEESYEIATAGEFWLECLAHLATQAPYREEDPDLRLSYKDIRTTHDDRTLGDRCLIALLNFADREGKRLVLIVENLNMMFSDLSDRDAGWRLRKVLQTEPRIVLLASATSRFDEIDNPEHALYEQFRDITLRPLDTKECAALWTTVSGREAPANTIRSLEILTGGSPRLIAIMARFGAELSFHKLMASLLDLIDDYTEYFKSHIEALPAQERRVYLALATLWKPASAREVSDQARMETSKCSALLKRMIGRGAVQTEGGSPRRKQYYLTERLYNIYYLLRRSRTPDGFVEALIHFMESYYSPSDLKDFAIRIPYEDNLSAEMQSLIASAYIRLLKLPALAQHREELLARMPEGFTEAARHHPTIENIETIAAETAPRDAGRLEQPHKRANESTELADAQSLFGKLNDSEQENRSEEMLIACDEMIRRFGESNSSAVLQMVAWALLRKGLELRTLNRSEDSLQVFDEVVHRFGESGDPTILDCVAKAINNQAMTLNRLDRAEESIAACDEMVNRFGESNTAEIIEEVTIALFLKGRGLLMLKRSENALAILDKAIGRVEQNDSPSLLKMVPRALMYKSMALAKLNRIEDSLAALNELVSRFGESDTPEIIEDFARALFAKGGILGELNRIEDSLAAFDELASRFRESEVPEISELVAEALIHKGFSFCRLNRNAEALDAYSEVMERIVPSDNPRLRSIAQRAMFEKSSLEFNCGLYKNAAATASGAIDLLGKESPAGQVHGYLIRARAILATGNEPGCERDIGAVLEVLPKIDQLPVVTIHSLMFFSVALGPNRMRKLIQSSPSATILLPLTTALELELGFEPRVAQEVREVAEDIRRDLAKLRKTGVDGTGNREVVNLETIRGERQDG